MGQVQADGLDEPTTGANALEEHHQLQLEEDDRVDVQPATVGGASLPPVADEAKVELRLEAAVDVVGRDDIRGRNCDQVVEAAGRRRTEHGGTLGHGTGRVSLEANSGPR
ncbi:MAG: hypothetical protein H0U10_06275 [Chloroflexia bacterium]|nr:hypothetical protein [Chloroflexia bacterium]